MRHFDKMRMGGASGDLWEVFEPEVWQVTRWAWWIKNLVVNKMSELIAKIGVANFALPSQFVHRWIVIKQNGRKYRVRAWLRRNRWVLWDPAVEIVGSKEVWRPDDDKYARGPSDRGL